MLGHQMRATRCSPSSDAASASAENHQTHITGLAHVTVRGSGVYAPASTTHRTCRAHPVQCLMSPRTASGECFPSKKHSCNFSKLPTGAMENMCFIFSKVSNPTELARGREEPKALSTSLTTTSFAKVLTPPMCMCVSISQIFSQRS